VLSRIEKEVVLTDIKRPLLQANLIVTNEIDRPDIQIKEYQDICRVPVFNAFEEGSCPYCESIS
jgi:hypothetical protein